MSVKICRSEDKSETYPGRFSGPGSVILGGLADVNSYHPYPWPIPGLCLGEPIRSLVVNGFDTGDVRSLNRPGFI